MSIIELLTELGRNLFTVQGLIHSFYQNLPIKISEGNKIYAN